MCANDMFECHQENASYAVMLPISYAPLSLPISRAQEEKLVLENSEITRTASIPISTELHRAFPEIGSFGSYGKAGLAC